MPGGGRPGPRRRKDTTLAYKYRGNVHDVKPVTEHTPERRDGRLRGPFDPSLCGTRRGYRQHQNHGVEICDACRKANTDYMRDFYRKRVVA